MIEIKKRNATNATLNKLTHQFLKKKYQNLTNYYFVASAAAVLLVPSPPEQIIQKLSQQSFK